MIGALTMCRFFFTERSRSMEKRKGDEAVKLFAMDNISRSEFLKRSAMAGAALLVSSMESWAITEDKKLRVGLIGCGSVSNRYLPQLLSSKMIEVVSLCDIKY